MSRMEGEMQSLRSQHADSLAQVESGYMPHSLVTCTRLAFLILASYFAKLYVNLFVYCIVIFILTI